MQLVAWYPHCRFVQVVRDGREVVCSLGGCPHYVIRRENNIVTT